MTDEHEPDGVWEECDECGGSGVSGHDCGEDVCACGWPMENMTCEQCEGRGGWVNAA